MITIISGTHRKGSKTLKVAKAYEQFLVEMKQPVQVLSLEHKELWYRSNDLISVENEYLIPSKKFIFIVPEYHGSFPGILKSMIDESNVQNCWYFKKALLVGIAEGRAGNLRGIDQLSMILLHLKMQVHSNQIPLSRISSEINETGQFFQSETIQTIKNQLQDFIDV